VTLLEQWLGAELNGDVGSRKHVLSNQLMYRAGWAAVALNGGYSDGAASSCGQPPFRPADSNRAGALSHVAGHFWRTAPFPV